jgi:hypothetical protein
MKTKTEQVPVGFTADVYRLLYLMDGSWPTEATEELAHSLEMRVRAKISAAERRKAYTEYKTAPQGSEERERARSVYLDVAGIPSDWRTAKEQLP